MVETEQSSLHMSETPDRPRAGPHKKKACLVAIVVLALVLAAGWYFCPWLLKAHDPSATQMDQRLTVLEQQVQTLNAKLDEMNAHLAAAPPGGSESSAALGHVQSDLTNLFAAIEAVQKEVKHTVESVTQKQQTDRSSLASAIAFMQLRAAAEAGRGFTPELVALKSAAPEDAKFHEILGRLEPYASRGAPVMDALREEFITLEGPVSVAVSKSTAQNWWMRLLSEMKGLISIRPLHGGGAMDNCTAAEEALSAGDLNSALTSISNLPPEAQDVLKGWKAKAEARAAIEASLHDLADRFTALATAVPVAGTQDEP